VGRKSVEMPDEVRAGRVSRYRHPKLRRYSPCDRTFSSSSPGPKSSRDK
jgi:hypothetical protein